MSFEDRAALQELNHLYAYYVDNFRIEEWASLFTEDTVFDESEFDIGIHRGRQAILDYGAKIVEDVQFGVHLMATHVIVDLTDTTARGTVFALSEALMKNGFHARYQVKYEDEYRKVDGAWKFAKRTLRKTFPFEILSEAKELTA